MKKIFASAFCFGFFIFSHALADDVDAAKKNLVSRFTNSIAASLENIIGGEGDTQVKISTAKDYKPEFSIVSVRPISIHHGVDAWFVQLQLNDHKVRGKSRFSTNVGIGYRKLSDSKNSFTGANLFLDYDEKGNARASIGLELRSSAFEVLANYYQAISDAETVGDYTERSLDGHDVSVIGQVPYLPWANIIANHYEWKKNKNSKDSKGDKLSLELTLTPNLIVDAGLDDNNIDGSTSFAKIMFVYPPRNRASASTDFVSDTAFVKSDMNLELLSIVRRSNKQVIESEGTGVVIGRYD